MATKSMVGTSKTKKTKAATVAKEEVIEKTAEPGAASPESGAAAAEGGSKRHEEVKATAFKMERLNYDKVIAFIAKDGWYKLGGHSALFYYHRLAKQLDLKPRLNPDSDFFSTFKEGIVSIRKIETLEANLKKLKIYRNDDLSVPPELYVFDLGYKISEEDVKLMENDAKIKKEKLNQMILPKVAMPELHAAMWRVTNVASRKIIQMNKNTLAMYGRPIMKDITDMQEAFLLMAMGHQDQEQMLKIMLRREIGIKCKLKMAVEVEVWPMENALILGGELVEVERMLKKALKALKTR